VDKIREPIMQQIGKALRLRDDGITHEALPERRVDLIHYLDEQEQKRKRKKPQAKTSN
jgi:hypothetical protein